MRSSDWSSDVCSSDLVEHQLANLGEAPDRARRHPPRVQLVDLAVVVEDDLVEGFGHGWIVRPSIPLHLPQPPRDAAARQQREHDPEHEAGNVRRPRHRAEGRADVGRSEEHTSELQSLMRNSYAVFCLKKKKPHQKSKKTSN